MAYKKKQQKNRSFIPYNLLKIRFGHSAIISVSSGFLSDKTINNFYIIIRKIFKNFKSISKFWIYLNVNYIITKKPLNVRMGKGKGSRKGLLSLVKSGNSILELKYCRLGLFLKIFKYISIRCSFNVKFFFSRYKSISRFGLFVQNYNFKIKTIKKIKNKYYIYKRMDYVLDYYEKSINMKRYKHLRYFLNKFYTSGFYFKFQKFFYAYFYFFYNLYTYTNLNIKFFLFYRKLLSFFKRKNIRRKRRENSKITNARDETDFNFKNLKRLISLFLKKKDLINTKFNFLFKNLKKKKTELKLQVYNFIKYYKRRIRGIFRYRKEILKENYIINLKKKKKKRIGVKIRMRKIKHFYFYNFIEYERLFE